MSYTSPLYEEDMDNEKKALCIRNVANFSAMKPAYLMEKPVFHPELLRMAMPMASPKLEALFEKIARLDEKDMRMSGKHYKHMIFTDVHSSQYGVKLLASAFMAKGFTPVFRTNGPGFLVKDANELQETKGHNFGLLCSKKFMDRNMSVRFRKAILDLYNARPENTHGENIRFMILDQGFKEGIDLFDVKYIHLFEPLTVRADEKQAIGRGTRFCGQKGLEFHPRFGWTLYVFRYDVQIPRTSRFSSQAHTLSELHLQYSNIDLRRVTFAAELEKASQEAAVDHALTIPVHQFKMEIPPPALSGGAELRPSPPYRIMNYGTMGNYIRNHFMRFKYPAAKLENHCQGGGAPQLIKFTPTQEFVRHYFQPESAYKGLLLYHATGTGKTCTAIATATNSFEKQGYTILWVTRHTLKSDIWKNMFKQVCSMELRSKLRKEELHLPEKISGPMKYMSAQWVEPMSYKQFTNMLLKKNHFYDDIIARNGEVDPLRKTLIVIDEAHKMYAPSAPASEKPDMKVFEKMIQNSYKKSGKDSCRLLLMTATPFTEDGMEMIQLLNLMKEKRDHIPTDFDEFTRIYLDEHGEFTKSGLSNFRNEVSGYISYLNRSQDGRNFAHPVVEDVYVNMTSAPTEQEMEQEKAKKVEEAIQGKMELQVKKQQLKQAVKELKEYQRACTKHVKDRKKECKTEAKEEYQQELLGAKEVYAQAIEECKEQPRANRAACKATAKEEWMEAKVATKDTYAQKQADCNNLDSKEGIKKYCDPSTSDQGKMAIAIKKELDDMVAQRKEKVDMAKERKQVAKDFMDEVRELRPRVQELNQRRKNVATKLANEKKRIRKIQDKEERKQKMKELRQTLGAEYKVADENYKHARARMNQKANERKVIRVQDGKAKLGDLSQETALMKRCKL